MDLTVSVAGSDRTWQWNKARIRELFPDSLLGSMIEQEGPTSDLRPRSHMWGETAHAQFQSAGLSHPIDNVEIQEPAVTATIIDLITTMLQTGEIPAPNPGFWDDYMIEPLDSAGKYLGMDILRILGHPKYPELRQQLESINLLKRNQLRFIQVYSVALHYGLDIPLLLQYLFRETDATKFVALDREAFQSAVLAGKIDAIPLLAIRLGMPTDQALTWGTAFNELKLGRPELASQLVVDPSTPN